ncbi:MAG TPA: AAA family ATPase, partial [Chlamydiales bacterium]|nr:AAA family ATPase [Chlamydiales bacterium]
GKTTIARRLLTLIQEKPEYMHVDSLTVGMLVTPALKTETAFLSAIMAEFNIPPKRSYAKSLTALFDYVLEQRQANPESNTIIVIDEAQKLTPRMLDVVHTLLNFESNTEKYIQIVLIGQRELSNNIDHVQAIKSRVAMFGELSPLSRDDTGDLIRFRWHTASAGKLSDPFTDEAVDAIHFLSGGLPRDIVKLCHVSLLSAASKGVKIVEADDVRNAAKVAQNHRGNE